MRIPTLADGDNWIRVDDKAALAGLLLSEKRVEVYDPPNNQIRNIPAVCLRRHPFAFSLARKVPPTSPKE